MHAYLIGASDNLGKLGALLVLALDNGFDDAGVIGAEVDEAMGDAGLPEGLEEGKGRGIHVESQLLFCFLLEER